MTTLLELLRRASAQTRWHNCSPEVILDEWNNLVSDCIDGYCFTIFEYRHDLEVRGVLELVIVEAENTPDPELVDYVRRIRKADERFKSVLSVSVVERFRHQEWWYQRVPRYGDEDFASSAREAFGLNIQLYAFD